MTTERDLIYTIWKIVRGGTINQDDPINERLMRDFLRIHRGRILQRAYSNGLQITDEVFQNLGPVYFDVKDGVLVSSEMPEIIRFDYNFGIKANIDDYTVSVLNSEEWGNSIFDKFNKFHPVLKFIDRKLYLTKGKEQNCTEDSVNSALNRAVIKLKNNTVFSTRRSVNIRAILVNTDNEPGYDFTKTSYPMSNVLIEDMINSVNAREFNLYLQTRSDEVGDNRNNNAGFNSREEM